MSPFSSSARPQSTRRLQDQVNDAFSHKPSVASSGKTAASERTATPSSKAHSTPASEEEEFEVLETSKANREYYDSLSRDKKKEYEAYYTLKYHLDGENWIRGLKKDTTPDSVMKSNLVRIRYLQAMWDFEHGKSEEKHDVAAELLEKQEKTQSRVSGTVKKPTEIPSSTKVANQPLPNANKTASKTGGGLSPYEAIFDVKVTEKDYQYIDGYPSELTRPMKPEDTKPSTAKSTDRKKLNDTQLLYEQYDGLDRKGKKAFENHYKQAKYGDPGRAFLKVFKQRDLDNRILRKNMDYFAKVDGCRCDFMSELLQSQKKAKVPVGDTTSGG